MRDEAKAGVTASSLIPPPSSLGASGLSARELEVLGLLSDGLSNPEIADRLHVSVRTVGRHVENIYSKIGVHRRREARQYARDHGLIGPQTNPDTTSGFGTAAR